MRWPNGVRIFVLATALVRLEATPIFQAASRFHMRDKAVRYLTGTSIDDLVNGYCPLFAPYVKFE